MHDLGSDPFFHLQRLIVRVTHSSARKTLLAKTLESSSGGAICRTAITFLSTWLGAKRTSPWQISQGNPIGVLQWARVSAPLSYGHALLSPFLSLPLVAWTTTDHFQEPEKTAVKRPNTAPVVWHL